MENLTITDNLEVAKHPCAIEAAFDLIFQLVGLCVVYLIFEQIGEYLIGANFSPEILLSLVVLPSIMVLKDIGSIFQPYFVSVTFDGEKVSVKQGILTTFEDSLSLNTVENVETVTTLLGQWKGYATLRVYTYGSWVEIPNVKNALDLKIKIDEVVKNKTEAK